MFYSLPRRPVELMRIGVDNRKTTYRLFPFIGNMLSVESGGE